jgi:hypothetical protein
MNSVSRLILDRYFLRHNDIPEGGAPFYSALDSFAMEQDIKPTVNDDTHLMQPSAALSERELQSRFPSVQFWSS